MNLNSNNYSVLIVEDNPADYDYIVVLLEDIASVEYAVDGSQTISEALEKLNSKSFDVLLLDLNLPDSRGIKTVETIKTIKALNKNIPIIVLTGLDDEELALSCFEKGIKDYLIKGSFNSDDLRRTISYAILQNTEFKVAELQGLVEHYRSLSNQSSTTITTAGLSGVGAISEREPDTFAELVKQYSKLLNLYLNKILLKKFKPKVQMEGLITKIGDLQGGPRDLLDIHLSALENLFSGDDSKRASVYTLEGRLFALEMMGLLVEYYRVGNRRIFF